MVGIRRRSVHAVAISFLIGLGACGEPTDDDGARLGETSEALFGANEKTAFDYFLGKGLTKVQAAGIIGNLDQESGVDPKAVQAGGPGRGIAQWSVGGRWDADANDNVVAYATAHGKSATSLSLQLDFIWYELTTFSHYGLASLKKATTVSGAVDAFATDFEACGTCLDSKRVSYAQAALTAYGNDVVDAGTADPAPAKHDAETSPPPDESDAGEHMTSRDPGELADTGGCSAAPSRANDVSSAVCLLGVVGLLSSSSCRRRYSRRR